MLHKPYKELNLRKRLNQEQVIAYVLRRK